MDDVGRCNAPRLTNCTPRPCRVGPEPRAMSQHPPYLAHTLCVRLFLTLAASGRIVAARGGPAVSGCRHHLTIILMEINECEILGPRSS